MAKENNFLIPVSVVICCVYLGSIRVVTRESPVVCTAAEEAMYPGETIAIDLEPSIEELLSVGLTRLESKPTWKLWEWQPDGKEFLDADSFRLASSLDGL